MSLKNYSPLRYPGGKNRLTNYVQELIDKKSLSKSIYIEPFCGGAAVALSLLINGNISNIIMNDYDKSIYAFWYCVLNHTNELCSLIKETNITIDEWHKQKEIQKNKNTEELLKLGFSTLFLNRTNRSGIIKAGVIGGQEQNGTYKLNCRFNKKDLIEKIILISKYKDKIQLFNLDTEQLIDDVIKIQNKKSFIFFDPPYYNQGSNLYTNFYKHEDHLSLSKKIKEIKYHSWILTYDNNYEIKQMYKKFNSEIYKLNYSVEKKYKGTEIIFYSNTLSNIISSNEISISKYFEKL